MEKVNYIKSIISAALAVLTALWGWFGWLVVAWILCMAVDYITGTQAARRRGEWSSQVARDGIRHKVGCVVVVIVGGILDLVMGLLINNMADLLPFTYTVFLCPLLIVWYIITEAGSILENAGRMGAPVPKWATKTIASLRETVDNVGDGVVKNDK